MSSVTGAARGATAASSLRGGGDAALWLPGGRTRAAGVIGCPVRHSLSPTLHNAGFAALGLDWVYLAFEVRPGEATAAVAAMRVLGLGGLSVTMPHKDGVAAACDELSPTAELLGAVNCVRREGDSLIGENTDGAGFVRSLRSQTGAEPAGSQAVVLGAGGAARAVTAALAAEGAAVTVVNRSAPAAVRAAAIGAAAATSAGAAVEASTGDAVAGSAEAVRDADVVVNATSLGMRDDDPLPLDPNLLNSGQIVVDLIYRAEPTPLLQAAARAGATTLNGLGMLVFQAAEQFTLWTGRSAPVDAMAAAVGLDVALDVGLDVAAPGAGHDRGC